MPEAWQTAKIHTYLLCPTVYVTEAPRQSLGAVNRRNFPKPPKCARARALGELNRQRAQSTSCHRLNWSNFAAAFQLGAVESATVRPPTSTTAQRTKLTKENQSEIFCCTQLSEAHLPPRTRKQLRRNLLRNRKRRRAKKNGS